MKQLGAKFGDTQHENIKVLSETLGLSKADIARAAMQIGINQVQGASARDLTKGLELALTNSARGKM